MIKYLLPGTGLLITAAVVGYLIRTVSISDVIALISAADITWLLVFLVCSLVMSIGHTWRYNLLLASNGVQVNSFMLYLIVLVRNMGSDLLPARIGTAIYIVLANRGLKIPLEIATTSFGYAMLFDYLVMAPLVVVLALFALENGDPNGEMILLFGLFLSAAFLIITNYLPRIAKALPRLFRNGALKAFSERVAQGVEQVSKAQIMGRVLLLTLIIRIFKYAGLFAILMALLAPSGADSALSPAQAIIGIYAAEVSASLPISGPAGIGTYQGVWLATFRLLGLPENLAASTGISHHLITQVYGYSLGLLALGLFFLIVRVSGFNFTYPPQPTTRVSFAVRYLALLLFASVVIFSAKGDAAPKVPEVAGPGRQEFLESNSLIFDSNLSGTFGIYQLGGGASDPQAIIDDPRLHEMYPAIETSGTLVAYASSGSAKRGAQSEIWVYDRQKRERRRISDNGTFPSFSSDGTEIYFERNRKQVIASKLSDSSERVIFPIKGDSRFRKFEVVKPRISPDGLAVAFTSDADGRWHAYSADLTSGEATLIGKGCQPYLVSRNSGIFVNESGIFSSPFIQHFGALGDGRVTVVDRRREYFPSIRSDLVYFGRGRGSSHESDNYEIFAQFNGRELQLTDNGATNRWPVGVGSR